MKIIPLGEECYTCECVQINGLRQEAYPFDYVGHTYMKEITAKFKNGLEMVRENVDIRLFETGYYYVDCIHGFKYWHDTTHKDINDFTEIEMNIFINKYNRRYTRLKNAIDTDTDDNLMFLCVNHFDNIYNNIYKKEEIVEFGNLTGKSVLAINYTSSYPEESGNIQFVSLPVNKELTFEKSKLEFKSTLNEFISKIFV